MSTEKKVYTVPVKFVFEGKFSINAVSKAQAREYAKKHCGLTLISNGIHSTLSDEDVDWEFPVHPKKIIK